MRPLIILCLFMFLANLVAAQYPGNQIGDTIHAVHYDIHLEDINTEDKTIAGFTEIKIVPLMNDLQYIPLEIKDLIIDSVFINGTKHNYIHEGEILRIPIARKSQIGDTLPVTVFYHGTPFHESWGGFHFSGDYAFNLGVGFESIPHNLGKTWFPCIDDFTDRATYDFYITVNNELKAICGGTLLDTISHENGTKTWHWKLSHPIPTYLASVAIGEYELYSDEYTGLENTIPIHIYTRPTEIDKVEGSFVHLKEILQWYEERFGPYPFSRVGYTGTAIGAMEHATNIAYPHFSINGNTQYESLYTHELAHMWFGDMVTCSSAEDMWLNEGWATFCALYYLNDLYSYEEFINNMRHEHREVLRTTHKKDGGYYALNNIPQEYTYGSHAYDKGGSVTNTLRGYLGDELFFASMTAYLDHFRYQSVSSENMRDFLTDYTGINMTPFFDAWVMTPGTPHFSIDSIRITEGDASYMVDIWLKQKYKGADFFADNNILEVNFVDHNYMVHSDTVHFSGETGHSVKYLNFEPKTVFLDLFEKIGDATTDYYRFFTEPVEYTFSDTYFRIIIDQLADSAMVRVTHNWVAPDDVKIPVEGLRLSPYRHWKIVGVFPEGMKASGRFRYDYANYLDDDLILSDSDSVVILYRTGPKDDWHEIPQTRFGKWNIGYVYTDELFAGEYTLAVWDKILGVADQNQKGKIVNIFPNPSKGKLNFHFEKRGNYKVLMFDGKGSLLNQFTFNGKTKSWKWKDLKAFTGIVFVHVYEEKELLTIKKLVFTR